MAAVLFTSCGEEPDNPQIKEVTSIELNKTTLTLEVGQSEALTANVLPADATDKSVTWTSSDASVASVANGVVTAKAVGTATITAKAGNKTATCVVSVLNEVIAVESIELNETSLSLSVGDTETLTANVLPANATDPSITWTSSNASVVSVTNGVVTAKAVGTATITAKAGNKTATCAVVVNKGVLINGVRWATCNVDAFGTFAPAPESSGMFYQWNRPQAWAATGSVSGWNNTNPTGNTWTTANDSSPAGWRVPTQAEIESLLNTTYVTSEWTTLNGVNGRRFTDIATGNTIFLPAAGLRGGSSGGTLSNVGTDGGYWSSTEYSSNFAYGLSFNSGGSGLYSYYKAHGFSVRPVSAE